MSSYFTESGEKLPVTLLQVDGLKVVAHKNVDKDGYDAIVLGSEDQKAQRVTKPMKSFFAKSKVEPKKNLKEFRISSSAFVPVGHELKADHFVLGQKVDATSISIGKGFAGGMKRHNFRGLEATHGVSVSHRSHGSTGGCQDPGKVWKGKKMAGHLGAEKVTIQNLVVAAIDKEKNIIMLVGSVPGSKGSTVYLKDAIKSSMPANAPFPTSGLSGQSVANNAAEV